MKRWILYIQCITILIAFGCNEMELSMPVTGEKVNVHLNLDIAQEVYVNTPTKADDNVMDNINLSDAIKNIWIIQYNGISDNSTLVGEATYIPDFENFNGTTKLVATDDPCTIFIIANTFADQFPLPQGSTITDLKTRLTNLSKEEDVLTQDGSAYYPIFNSRSTYNEIDEGTHLSATLKRNIAKATFNITNSSSGSEAINIDSVQICSVPAQSYYITDYINLPDIFPANNKITVIDYKSKRWPEGKSSYTFTSYLPINMRGNAHANTAETYKNRFAPEHATHLVIYASYKHNGANVPVIYTFYLGSDMVNDFNIEANKSYTYSFEIKEKGDPDSDSRITDWGTVDFSDTKYPLSNSYILNPPITGTAKRSFKIPIQRIKTFWGTDARKDYEDDAILALRNNAEWEAFVLASDFTITSSDFEIVKGNGRSDSDRYFEVAVAPGVEGNIVIAVGPKGYNKEKISWSWHLWITDYNPDEALDWGNGTEKKYIYPVINGAVHRYEGSWWNINKEAYIMDRNLGAFSDCEYPADNRGLLYYQYGRKDPFMFYYSSTNNVYKYPTGSKHKFTTIAYATANGSNNTDGIKYGVTNPLHLIKAQSSTGDWISNNKYNPEQINTSIIWQDPYTANGEVKEGEKSIFDPCPPGYRVPNHTIWSDFTAHHYEAFTTNAFKDGYVFPTYTTDANGKTTYYITKDDYRGGFEPYYKIKGLQYWPYQGANMIIPSKVIYIPASGCYKADGVKVLNHGNLAVYSETGNVKDGGDEIWSFLQAESVVKSDKGSPQGRGYTSQPNHLMAPNSTDKARGLPVRCITDK